MLRRSWLVAGVAIAALVLAGVWIGRAGRTATGAPSTGHEFGAQADRRPERPALAVADATDPPGLRVEVIGAERLTRDIVEIRVLLVNRDPGRPLELGGRFAERPSEAGTLSGAVLETEGGRARYFILRDQGGRPACSEGILTLSPGGTREAWARFASPGAADMRVALRLKGVPPLSFGVRS